MVQVMKPSCVHHYVLESPRGPTVKGRCKKCGATRSYPSAEEMPKRWSDKTPKVASS